MWHQTDGALFFLITYSSHCKAVHLLFQKQNTENPRLKAFIPARATLTYQEESAIAKSNNNLKIHKTKRGKYVKSN